MEAISPVFAALGVTGCEVLDELAHWLDGSVEPPASAETSGWARNLGDLVMGSRTAATTISR